MRRPHVIKDNKSSDYPQQCIWFDTETMLRNESGELLSLDEVNRRAELHKTDPAYLPKYSHELTMGYACYMRKHRDGVWTDETWLRFTTRTEFWRWVNDKVRAKTKLYLFCHNTAFDLPVLDVFHELPSFGWTLKSAIIDAPPTILRFHNGSSSILILDTLNFFRMPLAYLGEEIGLPKLDMPDNNDLSEEWDNYAKRDVEIIRTACINWWEYLQKEDLGSFAPTLAGQSMRAFRHKYMKHQIYIDDNPKAIKLSREAYYGGRVECFRIGRFAGRFRSLDVNSMYPRAMADYEYPFKLIAHTKHASVDDLRIWLNRYSVTARILLRTVRQFAPVRQANKLTFPHGTFEACLCTPELEYALQNAEILEVLEVAVYQKAPLFREMAVDMTDRKRAAQVAGDRVREFIYKKLINSFYGKWGQAGGKWIEAYTHEDLTCKMWDELDVETGKRIRHRQLGGLVQRQDEETESRDSFPAIAAHVTAYARMDLWRLIEKAGVDNTFYCDTDSLLVNDVGYERLADEIDLYRLGALKLVGEYEDIEIWGAKDYRFGTKEKHKGVRKKAVWLDGHTVKQEQWTGLKGLIQSGKTDAPLTKTIVKRLKRIYDKGVVQADGLVVPHLLSLSDVPQDSQLSLDLNEYLEAQSPLPRASSKRYKASSYPL